MPRSEPRAITTAQGAVGIVVFGLVVGGISVLVGDVPARRALLAVTLMLVVVAAMAALFVVLQRWLQRSSPRTRRWFMRGNGVFLALVGVSALGGFGSFGDQRGLAVVVGVMMLLVAPILGWLSFSVTDPDLD